MDRVHIVNYQGFVPKYMNPLRKMKQMKETYKTYESGEMHIPDSVDLEIEKLNVPIVGYTGFLPGRKAKNVYGESYQQTAIDNEAKKELIHEKEKEEKKELKRK